MLFFVIALSFFLLVLLVFWSGLLVRILVWLWFCFRFRAVFLFRAQRQPAPEPNESHIRSESGIESKSNTTNPIHTESSTTSEPKPQFHCLADSSSALRFSNSVGNRSAYFKHYNLQIYNLQIAKNRSSMERKI